MIVRLMGGLGNQMFQYAFGRALSLERSEKLILDTWSYYNDKLRNYELGKYNIIENEGYMLQKVFYNLLWNIKCHLGLASVLETGFGMECEHRVFCQQNVSSACKYLVGFWQNVEYFKSVREKLIEEFKYLGELSEKQKKIITNIRNENSIAMHVRRGDYLGLAKEYVNLQRDYYDSAIQYIKEKTTNVKIYLFSDDINWCRQEYADLENVFFVDKSISGNQYVDLELMRNCRHYIIANSTFSWWAAWLSENENKLVVAPAHWFCDPDLNERVGEALLQGMIRL